MTNRETFPLHPFAKLSSSQLGELARFTRNSAAESELFRRARDETGTIQAEAEVALETLNKEKDATLAKLLLPMEE